VAFDDLVDQALGSLPQWVKERLDNVEVLVEDDPPPGQRNLLGLYEGIPLTHRGMWYTNALPDRITLFRTTIHRVAGDDREALRRVVRDTVVHEIAHYFGISDERLDELGRA
jgi:predicted Zn-dependent protease with MMP-like domain